MLEEAIFISSSSRFEALIVILDRLWSDVLSSEPELSVLLDKFKCLTKASEEFLNFSEIWWGVARGSLAGNLALPLFAKVEIIR